jgi:hypothetical protein
MTRSFLQGRNFGADFLFKIKIFLGTDTLNEMDTRMTRATNPYSTAQVNVCPVVINKLHRSMSLAQFATLVGRVRPFIFNSTELFFKPTLSNAVLPHVVPGCLPHLVSVLYNIFAIALPLAVFALVADAVRAGSILMKHLLGQVLLASVANRAAIVIAYPLRYSHALLRACPAFMGVRRRYSEVLTAYTTLLCNGSIVPRSLGLFSTHI